MKTTLLVSALVLSTSSLAAADPAINLGFERPLTYASSRTLTTAAADATEERVLPEVPKAERETTIFGLPKNVGPGDRIMRTVIGAALVGVGVWGLSSSDHLSDTTSYLLMGVSAVPFATAATGYCPLYQLVGIDRSF